MITLQRAYDLGACIAPGATIEELYDLFFKVNPDDTHCDVFCGTVSELLAAHEKCYKIGNVNVPSAASAWSEYLAETHDLEVVLRSEEFVNSSLVCMQLIDGVWDRYGSQIPTGEGGSPLGTSNQTDSLTMSPASLVLAKLEELITMFLKVRDALTEARSMKLLQLTIAVHRDQKIQNTTDKMHELVAMLLASQDDYLERSDKTL